MSLKCFHGGWSIWLDAILSDGSRIRFIPVEGFDFAGSGAPADEAGAHEFPRLGVGFYRTIPNLFPSDAQTPAPQPVGGETVFRLFVQRLGSPAAQ